jgi:hypothetical protein
MPTENEAARVTPAASPIIRACRSGLPSSQARWSALIGLERREYNRKNFLLSRAGNQFLKRCDALTHLGFQPRRSSVTYRVLERSARRPYVGF